ncbi:MAG TPA: sigma-70 family RNA polymerase sigma factor [Verrucomicrobiae bacterium]|nr:sigma-70 family RNA polymerase sigma factor [Verrucomicrobiae bacterium]
MQTKTDAQLLREYAGNGSETAFSELVSRHADLVYSAALRQVIEPDFARDVAQSVFADLARKAKSLSDDVVLAGWLYRSTRFAALTFLRNERRRQNRERQAMQLLDPPGESSPDWDRIRPVLDEAMTNLGDADRDALVLRFFKNEDLRAVGTALGTSEAAAQKRVTPALEKLRAFLLRRGVTLSSAALASALTGSAVQAAPAALAGTISTAVIAGAATAAAGSTFNLLNLMSMTKLKAGLLAAAVVVGAGTPVVVQQQSLSRLRAENEVLREQSAQLEQLRSANQQLAGLRADGDELERLRRDVAELHRLRAEVARLRREKEDAARLVAENAQLRGALGKVAATAGKREAESPEQDQFKSQAIERMNYVKHWVLAFMLFAEDNEGRFPADFGRAQAYYGGGNIGNLSSDQFEIVHTGKLSEIPEPARTIIIREKEIRYSPEGKPTKAYGFADGHSEIHTAPNGDFSQWEQERMVSNTAP